LWLRYKEYEHRCVAAERKLQEELGIRVDYIVKEGEAYGEPAFVQVRPPKQLLADEPEIIVQ
jgi:hypothetical protein